MESEPQSIWSFLVELEPESIWSLLVESEPESIWSFLVESESIISKRSESESEFIIY